jgi:hypothetical protein
MCFLGCNVVSLLPDDTLSHPSGRCETLGKGLTLQAGVRCSAGVLFSLSVSQCIAAKTK